MGGGGGVGGGRGRRNRQDLPLGLRRREHVFRRVKNQNHSTEDNRLFVFAVSLLAYKDLNYFKEIFNKSLSCVLNNHWYEKQITAEMNNNVIVR